MTRIWTVLVLSTLASAAVAQSTEQSDTAHLNTSRFQQQISLTCEFVTECYDTEACGETQYSVDLVGQASGLEANAMVVSIELSSAAGTEDLVGVIQDKTTSLSGGTFAARHFMTIAPEGAARYSVHYASGPIMISYAGECR